MILFVKLTEKISIEFRNQAYNLSESLEKEVICMPDSLSELAKKYREEMLRMYSNRPTSPPKPTNPPSPPKPTNPSPPPKPINPQPPQKPINPQPPQPRNILENSEQDSAIIPVMAEPMEPNITEIHGESAPEALIPEPKLELEPEPVIEYEEPVLPDYIQPVKPVLPKEWTAQEAYEQRNTAEGKLYIVASTADSAYPVPDARVTIYSQIDGKTMLNYILKTDESGLTPVVNLPAPPANLSQEPENIKPYATYNVKIYASGYFREEAKDVPIFAGITSRQVFQMIPLPLAISEDLETIELPSQAEPV